MSLKKTGPLKALASTAGVNAGIVPRSWVALKVWDGMGSRGVLHIRRFHPRRWSLALDDRWEWKESLDEVGEVGLGTHVIPLFSPVGSVYFVVSMLLLVIATATAIIIPLHIRIPPNFSTGLLCQELLQLLLLPRNSSTRLLSPLHSFRLRLLPIAILVCRFSSTICRSCATSVSFPSSSSSSSLSKGLQPRLTNA